MMADMLKGFTHARLACGCRLAFREGVEGSPVAVVIEQKGLGCIIPLHVRDLPVYDHDDLSRCFTDLDEKLRTLLDTVVPVNFVALPLKLAQPSIYATAIDNDKYLVNTKMYLALSAETSQAEIVGRAPQLVKVCSSSHIEHLVRNALPGVPLTYVASPPSAIPVKLNYQYFSLNQAGAAWEAIQRARNLAAYVPGDLPNPQLELIIVLPQGDQRILLEARAAVEGHDLVQKTIAIFDAELREVKLPQQED